MSRWIDADALPRHGQRGGLVHWKDIEEAPSIDLVFCKECERANYELSGVYCGLSDMNMGENGCCSVGKRKENER